MRSVVVVLPASMWAMMPMFRVSSRSLVFAILGGRCQLPAVVREGLVRFRHAVGLIAFADGRAGVVGSVEQFGSQFFGHAFAATAAGRGNQPAHGQRLFAVAF